MKCIFSIYTATKKSFCKCLCMEKNCLSYRQKADRQYYCSKGLTVTLPLPAFVRKGRFHYGCVYFANCQIKTQLIRHLI